jgi:hypothetical protein
MATTAKVRHHRAIVLDGTVIGHNTRALISPSRWAVQAILAMVRLGSSGVPWGPFTHVGHLGSTREGFFAAAVQRGVLCSVEALNCLAAQVS